MENEIVLFSWVPMEDMTENTDQSEESSKVVENPVELSDVRARDDGSPQARLHHLLTLYFIEGSSDQSDYISTLSCAYGGWVPLYDVAMIPPIKAIVNGSWDEISRMLQAAVQSLPLLEMENRMAGGWCVRKKVSTTMLEKEDERAEAEEENEGSLKVSAEKLNSAQKKLALMLAPQTYKRWRRSIRYEKIKSKLAEPIVDESQEISLDPSPTIINDVIDDEEQPTQTTKNMIQPTDMNMTQSIENDIDNDMTQSIDNDRDNDMIQSTDTGMISTIEEPIDSMNDKEVIEDSISQCEENSLFTLAEAVETQISRDKLEIETVILDNDAEIILPRVPVEKRTSQMESKRRHRRTTQSYRSLCIQCLVKTPVCKLHQVAATASQPVEMLPKAVEKLASVEKQQPILIEKRPEKRANPPRKCTSALEKSATQPVHHTLAPSDRTSKRLRDTKQKRKTQSSIAERSNSKSKRKGGMKTFCVCETNLEMGTMVCCDRCNRWHHMKCVGLTKLDLSKQIRWFCPKCNK